MPRKQENTRKPPGAARQRVIGRPRHWDIRKAKKREIEAFAAAICAHNSRALAFRQVFGKCAWFGDIDPDTLKRYARELEQTPAVVSAVGEIVSAAARDRELPDFRAMAIAAVRNLQDIIRGDYAGMLAALVGQPVSALDDLPGHLRGVVAGVRTARGDDGARVISEVRLADKEKAAETLARWAEIAANAGDSAFSAEVVAVDSLPNHNNGGGSAPAGAHDDGASDAGQADMPAHLRVLE